MPDRIAPRQSPVTEPLSGPAGRTDVRDHRDDRRERDREYNHHEQTVRRVRDAEERCEQCGDIARAHPERHGAALLLAQAGAGRT